MKTLSIQHIAASDPPKFVLAGEGLVGLDPVEVTSPLTLPVEGAGDATLADEMRWYLEEYLQWPTDVDRLRAERFVRALRDWGQRAFEDLFDHRQAQRFYDEATQRGQGDLRLQVVSTDAAILQWPWECLEDPEATWVGIACHVVRALPSVRMNYDPPELPTDRVNVLLVTARPFEPDVGFQSISRPTVAEADRASRLRTLRDAGGKGPSRQGTRPRGRSTFRAGRAARGRRRWRASARQRRR